jgi:ubiquinone/menaquinone biosynthesis C-methylase UbiE
MDTPDEAAFYDAMDHSEVNARFAADFRAAHGKARGGTILDLGTGTARIPIAICQADENARVLGVDLANAMLSLAKRNIAEAGLSARVECQRCDAKRLPFADGAFEAVISNTIIHHIPEPAGVFAEIVRLLAPEGTLFVRDLARPPSRGELERLVLVHAAGEPPEARALFAASLNAALTLDEVRGLIGAFGLPHHGAEMTSDRHWTWSWRRPF